MDVIHRRCCEGCEGLREGSLGSRDEIIGRSGFLGNGVVVSFVSMFLELLKELMLEWMRWAKTTRSIERSDHPSFWRTAAWMLGYDPRLTGSQCLSYNRNVVCNVVK